MRTSRKDQVAAKVVEDAIVDLFGREPIDRIDVLPTEDDHDGAALAVTVFLKADQPRVSGGRLLDAIEAALTALRGIDDDRFPYTTFLAPEYEAAEDTRPEG